MDRTEERGICFRIVKGLTIRTNHADGLEREDDSDGATIIIHLLREDLAQLRALLRVCAHDWIDADQVGIKSGMVDLGQRNAVGDDWLAHVLFPICHDMGRIEQQRLSQSGIT